MKNKWFWIISANVLLGVLVFDYVADNLISLITPFLFGLWIGFFISALIKALRL